MHHRLIAILAVLCFALGAAGCESLFPRSERKSSKKKKRERKQYEAVLMPVQTGSTLQRRMFVEKKADDAEPKKKSKKKESPTPKPAVEPADTPPPTEEATPEPTPERFR